MRPGRKWGRLAAAILLAAAAQGLARCMTLGMAAMAVPAAAVPAIREVVARWQAARAVAAVPPSGARP